MFWEKLLRESADLNVVSPETTEIFDEHRRRFAQFELRNHFLVAGSVHSDAGDTIVEEVNEAGVALFLCNLG